MSSKSNVINQAYKRDNPMDRYENQVEPNRMHEFHKRRHIEQMREHRRVSTNGSGIPFQGSYESVEYIDQLGVKRMNREQLSNKNRLRHNTVLE
jgi:hypothetical protein